MAIFLGFFCVTAVELSSVIKRARAHKHESTLYSLQESLLNPVFSSSLKNTFPVPRASQLIFLTLPLSPNTSNNQFSSFHRCECLNVITPRPQWCQQGWDWFNWMFVHPTDDTLCGGAVAHRQLEVKHSL